jgi:hypothetical protein
VRLWTSWNEPNNRTFLEPQWRRDRRTGWRPSSPHHYRAMHEAAYAALKRVSPENQVLIGGTAESGSRRPGTGGIRPLRFVRELACVDAALRPLRIPECRNFQALRADGFSHHPYSRFSEPGASDPDPDDVPIADTGRLTALLGALHERGRIASRLPLYLTEYGYETSPPDPFTRFSPEQQAHFMGWSTFLAWRNSDTRMFSQFLLRDIAYRPVAGGANGPRRGWAEFQTGLYYADGREKPAARTFQVPFWAELAGTRTAPSVLFFGQIRPGTGRQLVRLERRDVTGTEWTRLVTPGEACDRDEPEFLSDASGLFVRVAAYGGPAVYRMAWRRPDGSWLHSAEVQVDGPVESLPETAPVPSAP